MSLINEYTVREIMERREAEAQSYRLQREALRGRHKRPRVRRRLRFTAVVRAVLRRLGQTVL